MTSKYSDILGNLELGKKSKYSTSYDPTLLQTVPRSLNRDSLNIQVPFVGYDIWQLYEVSFLNNKGKPIVAIGTIKVDCASSCITESKSLKLYLNSFNNTKFENLNAVVNTIKKDVSDALGVDVLVELHEVSNITNEMHTSNSDGILLDNIDCEITEYNVNPDLLKQNKNADTVEETLVSHLLKSNCLITNQPDWGTVHIKYKGKKLDHESVLKYIISMRNHNEFHEHCVERIFTDLQNNTELEELCVWANYTRRGGIDINPIRASTKELLVPIYRLIRQ